MEIYYLQDNWLEGPISQEELEGMIARHALDENSPVWVPTHETWTPCSNLAHPADEETLITFEDTAFMHTREVVTQLERMDLPSPRDFLALRIAKEQELITANQAERCLADMMASPHEDISLPQRLHARGWVTASQRSHLEAVLSRDSVPKLVGGYEILEELGRGGMGTTYRARQISMDRVVAFKVLQPKLGLDKEYVRRFEREARMAARLNHENIATAYEVGSVAGQHYFSMEYVEGKTLSALLKEKGPFGEEEAAQIIVQVCRALDHAHGHEMIHRDISPKNIIVKPNGQVKLIDMGLTKSINPEASGFTTVGVTVGTPAYISPEQALGRDDIDIRSDIYSLGCVLYELLAGRPPLIGKTALETITMHIHNPVPSLKQSRTDASDLICHVVQKMTAMDPAERFQTPQDVIDGFAADDKTIRMALRARESVLPVKEQLAGWKQGEAVEFRLPVDGREYTHLIAQKLEEQLNHIHVDPEFQGFAQTLFAELVANAFDHGCKGIAEGIVRIAMEVNEAFFRIEVEDPGPGFAAQAMLEKIKKEPLDRERRRGIMQILSIADVFTYPKGNHAKAVLYRKSKGSGITISQSEDITFIEIKGKGDLALAEEFRRWVENYESPEPQRLCLMVRTDWVSSMFVGTIGKLHSKVKAAGSALSVWVEHISCLRIMEQLGIRSFVRIYDSPETAKMALRYATLKKPEKSATPADDDGDSAPAEAGATPAKTEPAPAVEPPASGSNRQKRRENGERRESKTSERRSSRTPPPANKPSRGWLGDLLGKLFGR